MIIIVLNFKSVFWCILTSILIVIVVIKSVITSTVKILSKTKAKNRILAELVSQKNCERIQKWRGSLTHSKGSRRRETLKMPAVEKVLSEIRDDGGTVMYDKDPQTKNVDVLWLQTKKMSKKVFEKETSSTRQRWVCTKEEARSPQGMQHLWSSFTEYWIVQYLFVYSILNFKIFICLGE